MQCSCTPVFTNERGDEFWNRLRALIDEYPEIYTGMDDVIGDHHDLSLDEPYDPNSPKVMNGLVLILNPANLQGYEITGAIAPRRQSRFLTEGLISNASYNS